MSDIKSIITSDMEHCLICGSPVVAMHHAISGTPGRKLADDDELIIPLCPRHHNMDTRESVHLNPAIAKWSKMVGQLAYEKKIVSEGHTEAEAREMFRRRYGKSYL